MQEEFGSFASYSWRFVGGKPLVSRRREIERDPGRNARVGRFQPDLKQRGFKFVGTTIMYAHMQATGMVNDHLVDVFVTRN